MLHSAFSAIRTLIMFKWLQYVYCYISAYSIQSKFESTEDHGKSYDKASVEIPSAIHVAVQHTPTRSIKTDEWYITGFMTADYNTITYVWPRILPVSDLMVCDECVQIYQVVLVNCQLPINVAGRIKKRKATNGILPLCDKYCHNKAIAPKLTSVKLCK